MKHPELRRHAATRTTPTRLAKLVILAVACLSLLGLKVWAAQFQEVTTAAGLSNENGYCVSAAWGDYDNDGYIDLYIAIGATGAHANALYHNNRDGTFTRQTGAQVGPIASDVHASFGCAWIDFNNDGYPDMLVLNGGWSVAKNDLYMNNGDGTFRRATGLGRLTDQPMGSGWAACADFDGDGLVDIFLSDGGSASGPFIPRLYHATPSGTFTTLDFGPAVAMCNDAVWGDYNNDGKPDLFVCNLDSPTSGLWRNDGQMHFTKMTNGLPVLPPSGGWIAHASFGDYDNDGNLDIAIHESDGTHIYRNDGNGNFIAVTNIAVASVGMPAWADYDNDGHLDLLLVAGQDTARRVYLYHNNGDGTFTSVSDPLTSLADTWLCGAWGDYDNDGFMDVVLTQESGHDRLYHNLGNTNHWIKFKLIGTASNRDAIGAKVRVKATIAGQTVWQLREINGGYAEQNDLRPNFGLGDATNVDLVRIEWPSGNVQELANISPNRIMTVTEAAGITPTQPSASLNGSVILTRTAVTGAAYQWQFEGTNLVGQTNQTLNLTNIVATQQGHYSVVAANATALVTNFVYLFVDTAFTKISTGPAVTDLGDCLLAGAWADYDGDGYPDLSVGRWNLGTSAIYHNNGDGTFARVTDLPFQQPKDYFGSWADWDNDGRLDLLIARLASNSTLLSFDDGQGLFSAVPLDISVNWWSCALADYNRDSLLDLYVSNVEGATNCLYRNNGSRSFTLMAAKDVGSGVILPTAGGACWGDFDDDGWPDLFAPTTTGNHNFMFRNDRAGGFVPVTNLVTQATGSAMAGAWGDYDNDGRLDLCVAGFNGMTAVYRNLGNGQFERPAGTPTLSQTNTFAAWVDYDNDGFLDLFICGYMSGNKLFHNNGDGTFTRVTTGSIVNDRPLGNASSFAGLWFDYDNDGFLDLYVLNGDFDVSIQTANQLYHNNGNSNAWLVVKPVGTTSNRLGIGAKVTVQATYAGASRWQRRDITGGDIYNGNQLYAHFGLGDATTVTTLRIEWPSGTVEEFSNIAPRQIMTVLEPSLRGGLGNDGQFHLHLTMSTNRVYQIQASSDLVTWTTLTNSTGSASFTPIEFIDPEAPSTHTARFYRMR